MAHTFLTTGRQKKVNPILDGSGIDRIRKSIGPKIRDLLLFDIAVETGVTANRLLQLRVKDLSGLKVGQEISILMENTTRIKPVTMGPKTHASFQRYLLKNRPGGDDLLFKSRKGNKPLSLPSASRLVSSWYARVGLKGMSGLLSLRKTWQTQYQRSELEKLSLPPVEPAYLVNPIQTPTAQELVYKELERALVTARIKPGERLIAEKLSRQMGISVIPIREAMGRLEARNFLTVQPKKGATANELSEKKFREILEIRLMLELPAARKAAMAITKGTVKTIKLLNSQYMDAQKENDADRALSVNREFHFAIYREAGMPLLFPMIQNLWDQVSPYYHLMFRQTLFADPRTGPRYHKKIIQSLAAKDPQKASKWLKTDLVESAEFVASVMRSIQAEKDDR
ncbi:MAG: hypothetical protein DRH90_22915 [Deltaproteobacteria bacterium]|nr:MAG: hypothetical protein DRH90_22915 [Deltaproteobacteria bacterium]